MQFYKAGLSMALEVASVSSTQSLGTSDSSPRSSDIPRCLSRVMFSLIRATENRGIQRKSASYKSAGIISQAVLQ
jgi:hypothetical protein